MLLEQQGRVTHPESREVVADLWPGAAPVLSWLRQQVSSLNAPNLSVTELLSMMQLCTSVRNNLAIPPSSRRGSTHTPHSLQRSVHPGPASPRPSVTQAQCHPASKCGSWNMNPSDINIHTLSMNPFLADINH